MFMSEIQMSISVEQALRRLVDGNERFLRGELRFPGLVQETLKGLVHSQHPYATILGCSDSRVPPEIIFDSGPGELFVIRVAGNVFSPEIAGSLQYAGSHLHTCLLYTSDAADERSSVDLGGRRI